MNEITLKPKLVRVRKYRRYRREQWEDVQSHYRSLPRKFRKQAPDVYIP